MLVMQHALLIEPSPPQNSDNVINRRPINWFHLQIWEGNFVESRYANRYIDGIVRRPVLAGWE